LDSSLTREWRNICDLLILPELRTTPMSARKHPPQLYVGMFSATVYCATRFHRDKKSGCMVADERFDVTENFDAVAKELARVRRTEKRKKAKL